MMMMMMMMMMINVYLTHVGHEHMVFNHHPLSHRYPTGTPHSLPTLHMPCVLPRRVSPSTNQLIGALAGFLDNPPHSVLTLASVPNRNVGRVLAG